MNKRTNRLRRPEGKRPDLRFWILSGLLLALGPAVAQQDAPAITNLFEGFGSSAGESPTPRKALTEDVVATTAAQQQMYAGLLDVQDKKFEEGIPKLEAALQADPALLAAWEALGWAYWMTGRPEDTRKLWERLISLAPDEPLGYNLMAQIHTKEGRLDRSIELYQKSLSLNPDNFETRFSLARVILWSGDRIEAVRQLRDLFRIDPDRIDVEIDLAWALYANEEYEESAARWAHVCEAIPDYPDYMSAWAQSLLYSGALDEAQALAHRILEIDENHLKALNLLADIAEQAGRPEDAIKALRKIQDLASDDDVRAGIARRIAVLIHVFHDRMPERYSVLDILRAAKEAADLDPRDIQGILFYAETLVRDKQFGKAAEIFEDILKNTNSHNVRARQGLLETYFGRRWYAEAEKQLRSNLADFNPHDPYRHAYWARLHFAYGRFRDAMDALDRLEEDGAKGAVFTLLYHGLSPSEFTDMKSVRQFSDQIFTLRRAGFKFITPDEFPTYFESIKIPEPQPPRGLLGRLVDTLRRSWTGTPPPAEISYRNITPDRVACITFDDALRTSFRGATPVGEDLGIRMAMHVPVGLVQTNENHVASWMEIKDYIQTGVWEIGSHLIDASVRAAATAEDAERLKARTYGIPPSRSVTPLPNLIWREEEDRLETLREYTRRVRREFRESREILIRELELEPEDVSFVAYVEGDIGQEAGSNIDYFHVPHMLLNEAEITYEMGFVQSIHGHAMKADHQMLLQRYEPGRHANGREVLRAAFMGHPVFQARRMRAEMAALQGELHLALETLEQLKRDGYPEELQQELSAYVYRRLARPLPTPDGMKDEDTKNRSRAVQLHKPYLGVEGSSTKANFLIDEWNVAFKAGVHINRRVNLEGRVGYGHIKQTVQSNLYFQARRDGVYFRQVRYDYEADHEMWGVRLNLLERDGSLLILDAWNRVFGGNLEGESILGYAAEYQWRPHLGLDVAARFQHDMVPSARALIDYDAGSINAVWRAKDGWHVQGVGSYAMYSDDNSMLSMNLENLWRLSVRQDIWFGLHNSISTTDRSSDLYWTPYWDQRHYFVGRIRRSFPNYYGMVQVHLGWQKEKARPEVLDAYNQLRIRAERERYYPGSYPEQGWDPLLGLGATLRRTWGGGLEASIDITVNALRDYTERNLYGGLLYRF
ncbi:MAG: tetratricopeptide repeat protein [Kiritimatiellia bacterium]|nr:tetratricopeptide repeat protein [Kiritimatiellia bacterium]